VQYSRNKINLGLIGPGQGSALQGFGANDHIIERGFGSIFVTECDCGK